MSLKNTTSYVALVKLIEACGAAGVKDITVNGTVINFYETSQTPQRNVFQRIDDEPVDSNPFISDNDEIDTDADRTLSDEITIDALEDLMLNDPAMYEEEMQKLMEKVTDEKDK